MSRHTLTIALFLALCWPHPISDQAPDHSARAAAEGLVPNAPVQRVGSGVTTAAAAGVEQITATVNERLRALRPGSTLTLPDPEGGDLELDVHTIAHTGAFTVIHLKSQGLASQVTLHGHRHMATIATPRGSYHVSDLDDVTAWIPQRVLDQRAAPNATDYRHAPVG